MNGGRPLFVFISIQNCNQDFNETVLETLSIPEKVLKMLTFSVMSALLLGLHKVCRQFQRKNFTNLVCTCYK